MMPGPRSNPVTPAEVARIVALGVAGDKMEVIAAEVGRSQTTVWNVLDAHGVRKLRVTTQDRDRRNRGKRMLRRGVGVCEVARRCGVTQPAVSQWLKAIEKERRAA